MPYITEIKAEADFSVAIQNFAVVCDANKVALGLTVPQLAEIAGATTSFVTSLTTLATAKSAAESAREAKDIQMAAARAMVAKWAKTFRANAAISDAILADLTVAPHSTPGVKTPATQPLNLVASADGNGNIRLQWKRNGNIQGTQFVIEYQASASDAWTQLGICTKRVFDTTWTPGSYIAFRVIAVRRGIASPASTPFVLWASGSEMTLKLAA